jgi:hypothetical protein
VRLAARLAALAALAVTASAAAQPLVVSPAPDNVAVTVYRDPNRDAESFIDLEERLEGFALITETRTVDLPPGPVTVRFEGVASGIQPETAILSGALPLEKNQDRRLLSRRGLVDAFTGQRVRIRRTDRATGKVTEESARIRSAVGDVILETSAGFETWRCTGLSQTLIFPGVPPDLSAKPTLSMILPDQPGGRATVTLAYLAGDFDWQANYVAELSEDASRVNLFAWVTLASRDDVSFPDAQAAAVAGRAARVPRRPDENEEDEEDEDEDDDRGWYSCWPDDRTGSGSTGRTSFGPDSLPELEPPLAVRLDADCCWGGGDGGEDIVVTGSRIMRAEEFNDFKLYRVPFPVTVAARSQKQVAFLSAPKVKAELLHRSEVSDGWAEDPVLLLRIRNEKKDGLGQPLPAGAVTLYQQALGRRQLVGESKTEDKAVGEEVELIIGDDEGGEHNVSTDIDTLEEGEKWEKKRLVVSNANPFPVRFEAEFEDDDTTRHDRFGAKLKRIKGRHVWRVTVPAEGEASLTFREVEIPEPEEEEEEEEEEDEEEEEELPEPDEDY